MNLAPLHNGHRRLSCRDASKIIRRLLASVSLLALALPGCFGPTDSDDHASPDEPPVTEKQTEVPSTSEGTTTEWSRVYYGIDRDYLSVDSRTTGSSIQVIDACNFVVGESIVIADVTEQPETVSGCDNGNPADIARHTSIPLTVTHQLAGDPLPPKFDLVFPSTIVHGHPEFGESILVSVIEDQGDYFHSATIYVNEEPTFIEARVEAPDHAVDLPSTIDELRSLMTTGLQDPLSVCTQARFDQRMSPSEQVTYRRTHREDPCNAGVHEDDGMP